MRLLFVSSTVVGGSGRSQRELARLLTDRGHVVKFLVDDGRRAPVRRWWYEQFSDLAARWGDRIGAAIPRWFERLPGHRPSAVSIDRWEQLASPVPENAFATVVDDFCPDVVVGNSLIRLAWRKIREESAKSGIATVLYVREVATFLHLEAMTDPADALVANAASLVVGAEQRGHSCDFVPSVIDVTPTMVESDRSVVLMINPIPSHGIDLLWELANRLPDVQFEIRESWPLEGDQLASIAAAMASTPNVALVRRAAAGPDLYARSRVLLAPHRLDNRPRVVVEAQANGIPVVASDFGGLREVVGPGGIVIAPDDVGAWESAVRQLWSDDDLYQELSVAARDNSHRAEIRPERVVDAFEEVLGDACTRAAAKGAGRPSGQDQR